MSWSPPASTSLSRQSTYPSVPPRTGDPVSPLQTPRAVEQRLNRQGRLLLVNYDPLVAELRDLKGIREVTRLRVDAARVAPKHPPLVVLEITRPAVASGSLELRRN